MTTTQTIPQLLTFDDYINQYPDDGQQYELIAGKLLAMMRPIGKHEEIGGFVSGTLFLEINRQQLPYFIPNTAAVKPLRPHTGYLPDIIVLDRENRSLLGNRFLNFSGNIS